MFQTKFYTGNQFEYQKVTKFKECVRQSQLEKFINVGNHRDISEKLASFKK